MFFKKLSFAFLFVTLLLAGCSKKSDNPVNADGSQGSVLSNSGSMVINGGAYSNHNVDFSSGLAAFVNSNGATSCILYGKAASDSLMVSLTFPSKSTGGYEWKGQQTSSSGSTYFDGCIVYVYSGSNIQLYAADNGKTDIKVFNEVGKTIEGNFNGTLKSTDGSQTITVNGSFKCLRIQDDMSN